MAKKSSTNNGKTADRSRPLVLSPFSAALRPVVKKILPQKCAIFQQLFDVWADLVARSEASGTIPEKLTLPRGKKGEGVLHIWAQTGAQAMEVEFNKANVMHKINTLFGYQVVKDLRVTAFPVANKNRAETAQKPIKRDSFSCQSLDKAVTGISNPQLRSALLDLGGVLPSAQPDNNNEKGQHHA